MRFVSTLVLSVALTLVPKAAVSQIPGASTFSFGRFAEWPTAEDTGGMGPNYEGDLVKRVYPDRIARTHKLLSDGHWVVEFGATGPGTSPSTVNPFTGDPDLAEDVNWVRKTFPVLRTEGNPAVPIDLGDSSCGVTDKTYSVTITSVAPGTWVEADASRFYIKNAPSQVAHFTHMAYFNAAGTLQTGLIGSLSSSQLADPSDPSFEDRNWIAFYGGHTTADPQIQLILPLMVSYSEVPSLDVVGDFLEFNYAAGSPRVLALALPWGIKGFSVPPAGVATWFTSTQETHCVTVASLVNNQPVSVVEDFLHPEGIAQCTIDNTFTHRNIYGGVPNSFVTVPPILALASDTGMDVTFTVNVPGPIGDGFLTKNGPLLYAPGVSNSEYTIPGMAPHDLHYVPRKGFTQERIAVDRLLQTAMSSDVKLNLLNQVWGAIENRGETYMLALASAPTRDRYVQQMRNTITSGLSNQSSVQTFLNDPIYAGKSNAVQANPFTQLQLKSINVDCNTSAEFPTLLWERPSDPYAFDIDATAGGVMEYLYEYLLWSGDEGFIEGRWDTGGDFDIVDYVRGLTLFHDWAFMASTSRTWGDRAAIDMLSAQYQGMASYAKMAAAKATPDLVAAETGRYLAAKTQLALCLRWLRADYATDHYKMADAVDEDLGPGFTQLIAGFGEYEPSGPLANLTIRYINSTQAGVSWADWMVSGERLHSLPHEVVRELLDRETGVPGTPYFDKLQQMLGTAGSPEFVPVNSDLAAIATFPAAKIAAGWREGIISTKSELDLWTNLLHLGSTEHSVKPGRVFPFWRPADGDWYSNGQVSFSEDISNVREEEAPFPIYWGLEESFDVPVLIGGWAPAKPTDIYFDTQTEMLVASFDSPPNDYWVLDRGNATSAWGIQLASQGLGFTFSGDPGSPGTVPENLVAAGDFETLGPGRVNVDAPWAGADAVVGTEANPPTPDNRAIELRPAQATISASVTANQWTYVGANTPYHVRFQYKTNLEPGDLARFAVSVRQLEDEPCGPPDTDCNDIGGVRNLQEVSHPVTFETDDSSHIVYATQWEWFEIRGKTDSQELARILFDVTRELPAAEYGPADAAFIDNVSIDLEVPETAPEFREPFAGSVYDIALRERNGEPYVNISWMPDYRVTNISTPSILAGAAIPVGEWWVGYQWSDDYDGPSPTWNDIPQSQIQDVGGGSTNFSQARTRWFFADTSGAVPVGTIQLKALYYEESGGSASLVGEALSEVFDVLPQPAALFAEAVAESGDPNGDGLGLDISGADISTMVAFNYETSGGDYYENDDLFVGRSGQGVEMQVYQNEGGESNWVTWQTVADAVFGFLSVPENVRGLSSANFNGGATDLFVAVGPASDVPQNALIFDNQSGSMVQLTVPAVDDAWSGSWAELGGAMHLFVARASATGATPTEFDSGTGLTDVLLRYDSSSSSFQDVTASAGAIGTDTFTSFGATWADVDGDDLPDLYVANLASYSTEQWSPLYIAQDPDVNGNYSFVDVSGPPGQPAPQFLRFGWVSGSKFEDLDGDDDMDIVIARRKDLPSSQNLIVCLNDGSGNLNDEPGWGLSSLDEIHDIEIVDLDCNGVLDVVAVPQANQDVSVFLGYETVGSRQYVDRKGASGISSGLAHSIVAADFNEDGDDDVMLGRDQSVNSEVYFTNATAGQQGVECKSATVILDASQYWTNGSAVGAVVESHATIGGVPSVQCRVVDGGSGRGRQSARTLTFGIGDATTTDIVVHWPHGHTSTVTVAAESQTTIYAVGPIDLGTATATYTPSTGSTVWTFAWETVGYMPGVSDHVQLEYVSGRNCSGLLPADGSLDLGDPGVGMSVQDIGGGRYVHTVTYTVLCTAPCNYNYRVQTVFPDYTQTGPSTLFNVGICGGFQG